MSERNSNGISYYKTMKIPGLTVVTGEVEDGEVNHPSVRFVPYEVTSDLNEKLVIGYLATDNARAIEILDNDANVEKIDKDEYTKYTDVENNPKTRKARG